MTGVRSDAADDEAADNEAQSSGATLDDVIRVLRHELRTPVNHIIGYSEMLLEDAADSDQHTFVADLRRVQAAGHRLLALINESLMPAQISAQGVDLATMRHEFRTPLNQVIGYAEFMQEEAVVLGHVDIIPDVQKIAAAAHQLLALVNTGISSDLSEIAGVSYPAPAVPATQPVLARTSAVWEVGGAILVVDDNEMNRDMLCRRLERLGYTVSSADNGLQALALVRETAFDLILLDIMMPEMDGYTVLEQFKADEKLRRIPVIVLSALDDIASVVRCIEIGAEDYLAKPFDPVLLRARIGACLEKKRMSDREFSYSRQITREKKRADDLLHVVIPIGIALSAERDFNRLLEKIVLEGRALCNADGGTLYLRSDNQLRFEIVRTQSLNIALGGTSGNPITFPPLLLNNEQGVPNHHYVVTHAALTGNSINIADAYDADGFDFSGTRNFDQQTKYRSVSFLTVPLKDDQQHVIGVLQLINAKDPDSNEIVPFEPNLQQMIESLSSLAAVVLAGYAREQRLRQQIEDLRIEVDEVRKAKQVAEITETDYFQKLREKARRMRGEGSAETTD